MLPHEDLQPERVKQVKKWFDQLDADRSGSLSEQEVTLLLEKTGMNDVTSQPVRPNTCFVVCIFVSYRGCFLFVPSVHCESCFLSHSPHT